MRFSTETKGLCGIIALPLCQPYDFKSVEQSWHFSIWRDEGCTQCKEDCNVEQVPVHPGGGQAGGKKYFKGTVRGLQRTILIYNQ